MEKANVSKNWGGARQGAGRKAMGATAKNVTLTFRLRPDQKERLFQAAAERGISAGELLARMIEAL